MKKKIVGSIVGLLIITTCFFSVTANHDLQLKKDLINNECSSSLNLLNDNKLVLDKSKVLKESCEHFAYFSSDDTFCGIYKGFLYPPYNTTCVCGQGVYPNIISSGTWTIDERLLVIGYSNGFLYEINLENCEIIFIGGGGVGLNGLTYDPTSGKVYGCSSNALYKIDPEAGSQELIGSFGIDTTMVEIACDAEGVIYGWDVKYSGESYLYEIDKGTGEASIVGGMGMTLCYAQDGDFCRECDILYLAAYIISPVYGSYLVECDEDTGNCTILGSFESYNEGFFVIPYQGNLQPIAEFNWTPSLPQPGETIIFNASESYDPDGYIKLYEWDWDDDGVFDENHTSPTATHSWSLNGSYQITLKVTDNASLIGIKTKTVKVGNQPPDAPAITGPIHGKVGVEYNWTFVSIDPDGDNVYYLVQWGDGCGSQDWVGPYPFGEEITIKHAYNREGTFVIYAKSVDIYDTESDWSTFEVTMPKNKAFNFNHNLLKWLFERYQNLLSIQQKLLQRLGL